MASAGFAPRHVAPPRWITGPVPAIWPKGRAWRHRASCPGLQPAFFQRARGGVGQAGPGRCRRLSVL